MYENNQYRQMLITLDGDIIETSIGVKIKGRAKDKDIDIFLKKDFLGAFQNDETSLSDIFKNNKFVIETIVDDKYQNLDEPNNLELDISDTKTYRI